MKCYHDVTEVWFKYAWWLKLPEKKNNTRGEQIGGRENNAQKENVDPTTKKTNWVCNAAKQLAKQTSPVLSPPSRYPSLRLILFSYNHREYVTPAVIAHDKVTCAPTRDGLNCGGWGGRGWDGGHMSNPMVSPPLPPVQASVLACKARERQWRQPAPLCWAPCWTLEGKETRQGEAHSNTHRKSVYVYAEFDREHTRAHREPTGQNRTGGRHVGELGANAIQPTSQSYVTSIKCLLLLKGKRKHY